MTFLIVAFVSLLVGLALGFLLVRTKPPILWALAALSGLLGVGVRDATAQGCYRVRHCNVAAYVAPVKAVVAYPVLYQVGVATREEAIAENAAKKALAMYGAQLRQEFSAGLSGRVCLDFNTAGGAATNGGPSVPSVPTPAPAGDHTAAQAVFNESCVSCHTGATAKGGLDLSDLSRLPAAKLQKAALRAYTGSMPPQPAQPIAQEKADALLKWAEKLSTN